MTSLTVCCANQGGLAAKQRVHYVPIINYSLIILIYILHPDRIEPWLHAAFDIQFCVRKMDLCACPSLSIIFYKGGLEGEIEELGEEGREA